MNFYTLLYTFSIFLSIILGHQIFLHHKNISGVFYYGFSIFASLWFLLYYVFFLWLDDTSFLLILSRSIFIIGILSVYSLLFFIKNYRTHPEKIEKKSILLISMISMIFIYLYVGTDLIVEKLIYDPSVHAYRESYGPGYLLTLILYIGFLIGFFWQAKKQVKKQVGLEKIRLRIILIAIYITSFILITLQIFLPYLGIWILEKEIILFFVGFNLFTYSIFRRYYFTAIGYGMGRILFSILALFGSIFLVIYWERLIKNHIPISGYWQWNDDTHVISIALAIYFYFILYGIFRKLFLGDTRSQELKDKIQTISRNCVVLTDFEKLKQFIEGEMQSIFRGKNYSIIEGGIEKTYPELSRFFQHESSEWVFINDIVFRGNNEGLCDMEKLIGEIPKNIFIIFPLYTNKLQIHGIFCLWNKPFWEFYTENEIKILKEFSFFLGTRLQSIHMYREIEDLSVNLDKKVDEKTMEYNDLINKQKEFIAMISHEVKTPIASAIFQADSIVDDIKSRSIDQETLIQESLVLQKQLEKIGELISKLFSVQYYDTRSVTLFRENIDIKSLLEQEVRIYRKIFPEVQFIENYANDIGYMSIDRIQFQQILTNIISNAVKHFDKTTIPKIEITAKKEGDIFFLDIEDNGCGIHGIDAKNIFDRYSTGKGEIDGLWLGLYLCKMIIEMHDGTISAGTSPKQWWAWFHITLPIS